MKGIKFHESTKTYTVQYSARHPVTRKPKTLRRKGIQSKREAEQVLRELIVSISNTFNTERSGFKSVTWSDFLNETFYPELRGRDFSKKTIENYQLCINAHTLGEWGLRTIDSIKPDEIRKLINERLANKSPSQRKNLLKFLRGAFKYAVEAGLLNADPCPRMQFRFNNKLKTCLTEAQAIRFLEKAREYNHEYYSVWLLALYTGMRSGELYALAWENINFENRQILVNCSWNSKDQFKSTKSGDDRLVEIAPNLLTYLKELKLKGADSPFLLPRIESWEKGRQAEILRAFLMGIELPQIRFHDLRASWATILLQKGIEPLKVMIMGGWKDLKTMAIYIRKAGVDLKGITDKLNLHDTANKNGVVLSFTKVSE